MSTFHVMGNEGNDSKNPIGMAITMNHQNDLLSIFQNPKNTIMQGK